MRTELRLKHKVCLITGAGSGIGRATSLRMAEEGAHVFVADRNKDAADETTRMIAANVATEYLPGTLYIDVCDRKTIDYAVWDILDKFGRIDVLVNNAGITADAQLKNMTEEQFDKVIDVNLKGVYNCTQAVVNHMIKQNGGVILTTSSVVGLYGNFGQTNYAASKAGVIGMTKVWARELGKYNIRANAVCPGFIQTPILETMPEKVLASMEEKVPLRRLGRPEEIANVFAFLASDDASYINGAVIEVGGGVSL